MSELKVGDQVKTGMIMINKDQALQNNFDFNFNFQMDLCPP